jgi:SAM-dependent methyltransferase
MTQLWNSAEAYDLWMGRWSRRVAPLFLAWLAAPPGLRWLDIGCGTGELSAAIATSAAPASLRGFDRTAEFLPLAAARVPGASFAAGDAMRLELPDATADMAVSGLLLNFLPDPTAAVVEMARLVRPGGTVALYVWDYAGQMQIMRRFFDAALELDPAAAAFDDGRRAPICRPGPLAEAFGEAGLVEVATTALDIPAAFDSFDAYWEPFLGGTGSAPAYCATLDPARRAALRSAVRARLPTGPDGEILLAVRAWAVKGRVPP